MGSGQNSSSLQQQSATNFAYKPTTTLSVSSPDVPNSVSDYCLEEYQQDNQQG